VLPRLMQGRRTVLTVVLAVFAVALGPYLVSRMRSSGRRVRVHSTVEPNEAYDQPISQIRLLAFNIAHGRGAQRDNWQGTRAEKQQRLKDIGDLIRESNADVVVLNEVDFCSTWSDHRNQAEEIARRAGYLYWLEQRNFDFRFAYGSWKFGNAILSRFPIVAAEAVEYPALHKIEQLFAGCKQGAICTLQLSESQQIQVLAVHLEHRSEAARVASARIIIKAGSASTLPFFAIGDFNSTPSSFPHAQQTERGENAMDLLVNSESFRLRLEPPTRAAMTYPSNGPTQTIDWILIPSNCRFTNYRTLSSQLSDHRPIVAEVRLPVAGEQ